MATIFTKLSVDPTTGLQVESEGTIIDLINPLVRSATTEGQLVKLLSVFAISRIIGG